MIIKTQLSEKDYIKVYFMLLFRKPTIIIIYSFFAIYMLLLVFTNMNEYNNDSSAYITMPAIFLILPLIHYFTAKRYYSTNSRLGEIIEYKLEKDYLVIQGESFKSEMSWNKIYKVMQTKNWVLIYQTRKSANIISKADIWEGERADLKAILEEHKVKNNL